MITDAMLGAAFSAGAYGIKNLVEKLRTVQKFSCGSAPELASQNPLDDLTPKIPDVIDDVTNNADDVLNSLDDGKLSVDDILEESSNIDNETVTYRRVQGGNGTKSSQQRINIDSDGNVTIDNKTADLNISIDNGEHSQYYVENKRPGADIYEFEVPKWFDDMVQEYTIPQEGYKSNPLNQSGMAPKLTDPTKPGKSYEFPAPWVEWIEEYATNGRIAKGGT